MSSTIQRTHRRGQQLPRQEWEEPVGGVVRMATMRRDDLNRDVRYLSVDRHLDRRPALPDLWDPQWLTFGSDRGCLVSGFEEIEGRRYYQSWYICWPATSDASAPIDPRVAE